MVHCLFDPTTTRLSGGSTQGDGDSSAQVGGGGEYFQGRMFQRGRGIGYAGRHSGEGMGDVLRGIWRYLKPMAKSVGKEAAVAGSRILGNIAQGADLKETVKEEGTEGVKRVLEKATRKLQKGSGVARRRGHRGIRRSGRSLGGRERGRNPKNQIILKPDPELVGKIVPAGTAIRKRAKSDTLGLY
jgi:hypothetical protein